MRAKTVLIMGFIWPEPTSSAAGVRDWDLIRLFKNAGWEIVFSSPSPRNDFTARIEAEGIQTLQLIPNDPSFDPFIAELQPEVVIFDRFMTEEQFGWRVQEHSPASLRVLDTIDLHFLRRARQNAHEAGTPLSEILNHRLPLAARPTDDMLREIAAIYRCDLTLILSSFEFELLQREFGVPTELLALFPFCYPEPGPRRDFENRADFVTIGNFRHAPNADATFWLKNEIWPLIRKQLPEARVHLYGAYPSREIMALSDPKQGFLVHGPAKDQFETLSEHRVSLAPLRFGAGIKGKIADSWHVGTPVVTTSIGAEGMTDETGFSGLVSGDAAGLADAAVRLYTSKSLWLEHQEKGSRLMKSLFHPETNEEKLLKALGALSESREARRARNFIGAMLSHHQHKSTKYFSRWIELKTSLRDRQVGPPARAGADAKEMPRSD